MITPNFDIEYNEINTLRHDIQCYCVSDLHAENEKSQNWVKDHCEMSIRDPDIFSVLILPGDIGSEMDKLELIFDMVANNYDAVCYVPGNHEVWKKRGKNVANSSFCKLQEVLDLAKSYNIYIGPLRIKFKNKSSVLIFPLYSWYHTSWDTEPDLVDPTYVAVEKYMPFQYKWSDFSLCEWPENIIKSNEFVTTSITQKNNINLAKAFASLNEPHLNEFLSQERNPNETIISFSHFLPRQELCPEKRFLTEPLLTRVIGSDPLEAQIRRLKPHLHLFGHTHIPMDLEIEGIRYIQWPLGYYRESEAQCAPIFNAGPLLVLDSELGGIPPNMPSLSTYWSVFYRKEVRNPLQTEPLAPWLRKKLDSFEILVYNDDDPV